MKVKYYDSQAKEDHTVFDSNGKSMDIVSKNGFRFSITETEDGGFYLNFTSQVKIGLSAANCFTVESAR